ncbi:MAG: UDP-glucuronic acid decarboxylase family protein [Granulosicoccaceae bacterium]
MKTILVTGGAGFLGSHLCDELLGRGDRVLCLDNLHTGSEKNIVQNIDNERFRFIKHDIVDPIELPDDFSQIDQIYNLACPASPVHYQEDPIHTTKTCVLGAINVLELGKRTGAVVFQASTSEVYGDPTQHPQRESYWGNVNTIGPRSCYDEGKRTAESLFFDYNRSHNVRIKVVRIFNTYGPRMARNDGRVVSNFVVQALQNEDITLYGDGNQTRSFCYVDDLISGFVTMMNTPDAVIGPINLGNPGEFTMNELASKVISLTRGNSNLFYTELPKDDPKMRKPDITKAMNLLNWQPRIKLDTGLARTIEHFREELGIELPEEAQIETIEPIELLDLASAN